jgi:curved DNA-binding protein CbpA
LPDSLPNYYEILGLPATATREEVRRRYRELARRYHPDVAKGDDAANRFKEINEANSVLSDTDKRSNYDAHRKLDELKRQSPSSQPPTGPRPKSGRQPPAENPNPQSAIRNPQSGRPQSGNPQPNDADTLLHEAQRAMGRLRYRDAESLARRANRLHRTSLGYEILGDVCRSRGRNDEAVAMYSYALQLDRANHSVQAKFDRLVGRPSGPTMAGGAARAVRRSAGARRAGGRAVVILASVLAAAAFVLVLAVTEGIGSPATGPWYVDWDWRYMLALGIDGALAGLILAANGVIPGLRQGLTPSNSSGDSGGASLAPLVVGLSVLSVYAALALYLAAALLTGRLSKSLILAFSASLVVTTVFAIVNSAAAGWTMLSGGNLAFLGFIGGWALGGSISATARR